MESVIYQDGSVCGQVPVTPRSPHKGRPVHCSHSVPVTSVSPGTSFLSPPVVSYWKPERSGTHSSTGGSFGPDPQPYARTEPRRCSRPVIPGCPASKSGRPGDPIRTGAGGWETQSGPRRDERTQSGPRRDGRPSRDPEG